MKTWLSTFRPLILVVLIAGLALALPDSAQATSLNEIKKLTASDAQAEDFYGFSVAISGDTAVVGASGEDAGGSQAGAAYILQRDEGGSNNWGEVTKLIASDAQAEDFYGFSVAISGDTAVVGASEEDAGGTAAGAAYVFQRNEGGPDNWGQVKKLTASDAGAQDYFGTSVAINGNTVVVGASGNDAGGGAASGAAYFFQRNEGGADNWGEVRKLTASDAHYLDFFGASVAVNGDTAIVGVNHWFPGMGAGKAHVLQRNEGGQDNWGEVKKLTPSDSHDFDVFGSSVAVAGDTAVIGAYRADGGGAAYVFERHEGGADNWGEVKRLSALGGRFGTGVTLSGDTAIIGAHRQQGGAAHFFLRDQGGPGNWGELSMLTASDTANNDNFGFRVAVSNDTALVGAYFADAGATDTGAAYVFDLLFPKPTSTATPTPTNSPTAAATPTATHTATPTSSLMVINVIGGNCDHPVRPTACAVPLDAKFTLSVQALEFPPGGYAGVQSFLDFGADLVYNPTDNPADELTWPDCEEAVVRAEVFGKGWVHACLSGLLVPLPASTYAGNIIDLSLSCSSEPSTSVVKLLPFGNAQAKTNGAVFVLPDGVLVIPRVSDLTIDCVAPPGVGGIALDSDLRSLPLETAAPDSAPWAVIAAIVAAAGLVAAGGVARHARRRRGSS